MSKGWIKQITNRGPTIHGHIEGDMSINRKTGLDNVREDLRGRNEEQLAKRSRTEQCGGTS